MMTGKVIGESRETRRKRWRGQRVGGFIAAAVLAVLAGGSSLGSASHVFGSSGEAVVVSTHILPDGRTGPCEDCACAVTMGAPRVSRWRRWREALSALARRTR
jgi:hypothetical protein